jgi:hypothetical protein
MNTTEVLTTAAPKMEFTYREWHLLPIQRALHSFNLETAKGKVVCTFAFSGGYTTNHLNLTALPPELQGTTEMYRDTVLGTRIQRSMMFDTVTERCAIHNKNSLSCH